MSENVDVYMYVCVYIFVCEHLQIIFLALWAEKTTKKNY